MPPQVVFPCDLQYPEALPTEVRGWATWSRGSSRIEWNSAGGMLVQAYAKSYPADVAGVVAMNPVVPFHMLVTTSKQCDSADDTCGRAYPAYLEVTKALSEDWPHGQFTQAGCGHELYLSNSSVVVAAINDALNR